MGLRLIAGRRLEERDRGDGPSAVLVNESFVSQYLRDLDPVGFRLPGVLGPSEAEIVGVVGDVRHSGLDAEPQPELYVSYRQAGPALGLIHGGPTLVVRTSGDPLAWASTLAPPRGARPRSRRGDAAVDGAAHRRLGGRLHPPRETGGGSRSGGDAARGLSPGTPRYTPARASQGSAGRTL